jgi:nucleoside-triphosphatase THEP1
MNRGFLVRKHKPSYVITGPRQVGKSTLCWKLMEYLHGRGASTGGVITIQNDSKSFFLLGSQQKIPFEASNEEEYIPIGKYKIHKGNLEQTKLRIIADLDKDYFFLDEVGILELTRRGFYPVLDQVLSRKNGTILVVRESVMNQFLSEFSIKFAYEIISVRRTVFDEIFAGMKRNFVTQ